MLLYVFLLVLLIPLAAIVLDSQVGRALAARIERSGSDATDLRARVATLEAEVERLQGEMGRLEEESTFLRRLLAERGDTKRALRTREQPD